MPRQKANTLLNLPLIGILIIAALLRLWYASDLPLNGDEVGVGVLQASGQALMYADRLRPGITSLVEIQGFVRYNPAFSIQDVIHSLRFAGMHPPLYYLLLHYTLRFIGGDVLTLRLLSIAMSLGSILAIYCLAKALHGRTVAVFSAALLAMGSYGVIYGSLVRPYPTAMLLALLSTGLAVSLTQHSSLSVGRARFWAYLGVVACGMYTVYQFVFVLLFHLIYLTLSFWREKKSLITLGAGVCIIVLTFVPWIPSLLTHLADITSHHYYFHRDLDLGGFMAQLFTANVPMLLSGQPKLLVQAVGLVFYGLLWVGFGVLWKTKRTRPFVIGLAVYFATYFGAEAVFRMSTATVSKFLFFIIPITLLVASIAVVRIFQNRIVRGVVMSCGCGLLLLNSVFLSMHRDLSWAEEHAEESYVRDFAPILNSDRQRKLILINTLQRRYLFAFVHALHTPGDFHVSKEVTRMIEIPAEEARNRYEKLYLVNLYVDYDPDTFLATEKLHAVSGALGRQNFRLIKSVVSGNGAQRHSLLIFGKPEAPSNSGG